MNDFGRPALGVGVGERGLAVARDAAGEVVEAARGLDEVGERMVLDPVTLHVQVAAQGRLAAAGASAAGDGVRGVVGRREVELLEAARQAGGDRGPGHDESGFERLERGAATGHGTQRTKTRGNPTHRQFLHEPFPPRKTRG